MAAYSSGNIRADLENQTSELREKPHFSTLRFWR